MISRSDKPRLCILLLVAMIGCSDYQGISPTAYQYAKALYNVSNRKRTEKLESVTDLISTSEQEGTITAEEAEWLRAIIDDAHRGEWEKAQQTARQMMRDQVR